MSSVLLGMVVDAPTKQPIANVVVTATSRNLQGEQVVVTDADGNYWIPELPPGDYQLSFARDGFDPTSRKDIRVPKNETVRVDVQLIPKKD